MNIFYLDKDPVVAAQMQCDKHVVKMILESAQMLSTAHWILESDNPLNESLGLYKPTHKNHPSTKWARSSAENYFWLYNHFVALCDEYTYRYDKVHLSDKKLRGALLHLPMKISNAQFDAPPLAMPDEFKAIDAVQAYRAYYQSKQDAFKMTWTRREKPEWFKENADIHD